MTDQTDQIVRFIVVLLAMVGLGAIVNAVCGRVMAVVLAAGRVIRKRRERRMLAAYEAELLPATEQLRDEAS